jgi:hypothetical protein
VSPRGGGHRVGPAAAPRRTTTGVRLARYDVIEFTATRTAQELSAINEAIAS